MKNDVMEKQKQKSKEKIKNKQTKKHSDKVYPESEQI